MESWAATKKLYHTRSVAVTPAPVQVLTQQMLVPSFTSVVGTFHLALMLRSRKLHRSVVVTPAPVQVLTQWLLVLSFTLIIG